MNKLSVNSCGLIIIIFLLFSSRIYFKFFNSSIIYNLLSMSLYLTSAMFLLSGVSKKIYRDHKPIMLLLVYVFVSIFWSYDRLVTLKATVFLFLSSILFLGLLYKSNIEKNADNLKYYFLIVVVFSSIFYFIGFGQMGEPYPGVLNGIFPHKNLLGRVSAIGVIFFLCRCFFCRKKQDIFYLALCFTFLLLSESRGAVGLLAISFVSFALIYSLYNGSLLKKTLTITIVVFVIASISYVLSNAEMILELLGKDVTLTGRTYLWQLALEYLSNNYLFGYGFDTFWTSVIDYNKLTSFEIFWDAPHAHNGYLDLLLDVGLVGLLIYLSCNINLIKEGMKSIKFASHNDKALLSFSVLTLIYLLVSSFVEKAYFQYNDIQWCFFIFSSYFIKELKR